MKSRTLAPVVLLSQRLVGEMHSGRAMPRPGVARDGYWFKPRHRKESSCLWMCSEETTRFVFTYHAVLSASAFDRRRR